MRKLLSLIFTFSCLIASAQVTFNAPAAYTTGVPSGAPSIQGSRIRVDLLTNKIYQWNPSIMSWVLRPDGITEISGCADPAYTPTAFDSPFAINKCDTAQLYYYFSGAWHIVGDGRGGGSGGGGSTNLTFTGSSSPFTLANSSGTDVTFAQDTGILLSRSSNQLIIKNSAPDKTVVITGATGTYPNFALPLTAVAEGYGVDISGTTTRTVSVDTSQVATPYDVSQANQTVTAGTGISVNQVGQNFAVTNTGDLSATNELNQSFEVGGGELALTDNGGTLSIPLSEFGFLSTEVDGDPANELQTLYTDDRASNEWIIGVTPAGNTLTLESFTSSLSGLTPGSGGGTTNFLRADGTWAAPPGSSISEPDGQVVVGTGTGADSYPELKYLTTPNDLQLLNTSGANNANLSVRTTDTTGIISTKSTEAGKVSYYADDNATTGNSFISLQPTGQTLSPNLGPFNINGRLFPGVNAPFSTVPNYVYNIGYNYANNTSRQNAHEVALGLGFETFYMSSALASGSTGFTEFHIRMTDTFDTEHRFMTAVMPWDAGRGKSDVGFLTDNLYFSDYANSPVWAHAPLQNLWDFTDTTHMRFSERRGFNLSVLNGAGTAYLDVLKFDGEDTLSIGGNNLPGVRFQNDVVFNNSRLFPASGITQFDIGTTARPSALYVTGRGFYDSRVQILNNYSSTSVASNDNFNSLIFKNTNSTDNNWSALSSYNNTGTIASCIGFQHISQSSAYDEIAFYTRHTTGFQQRFRIGSTITAYHPFVANNTFTAAQTSTFTGDATFNSGAIFNAQPTFNTTVNIGNASAGSRLNVVNDYSGTSAAGSSAYSSIQLSNRNTTNNNWSAIEWAAGGAFGGISSDIAAQFTDHSSLYSDLVFHVRTDAGFQEAMRIKGGVSGRKTGINNNAPSEALDITGNVRFSGALMPNNAAGSAGQVLTSAGAGAPPTWAAAATGDITNGGNTTGAAITIGTNDNNALNFETNNVTRVSIASGASTGGEITNTNVTANTSTVQNAETYRVNSTGTAAAGFGARLLMQLESSTADNQDAGAVSSIWTTATHASRTSAMTFSGVNNAGSLGEFARFEGATAPVLKIASAVGTAGTTTYSNAGIASSGSYAITASSTLNINTTGSGTVDIGNSEQVRIKTSGTSNIIINHTENTSSSTGMIYLGGTTFTQTSGTRTYMRNSNNFSPTSGTAVHNQFVWDGTFNQTGGANGITRCLYLNQTLTAVADFRAIDIAANNANAKGIYQTGALTTNNLVGKTTHGATTAPTALLMLAAGTATANTAPLKFTSGTNLTAVENGAVEYDGTDYFVSSGGTRYLLTRTLRGSATLDFPSTAAGTVSDLTITVTGAADGDVVSYSVPNASQTADGRYSAWVSAADTVTIRFSPISTADPASGTFKATVQK